MPTNKLHIVKQVNLFHNMQIIS